MIRTPEEWLHIYRDGGDEDGGNALALANRVLDALEYYNATHSMSARSHDLNVLLNVFIAMQMDGLGRS